MRTKHGVFHFDHKLSIKNKHEDVTIETNVNENYIRCNYYNVGYFNYNYRSIGTCG
jgi:hypothetical protein